jgi:hypothetical protein
VAEVEKGKKSRRAGVVTEHRSRRVIVYQNRNKPAVSDVAGAVPYFDDDDDGSPGPPAEKRMMPGNPHDGPDYSARRVSEPLLAGHQAPSTGDHGPGHGRNAEIAQHHPDLRQSTTTAAPWYGMRTFNGDNEFGDRSITHPGGQVGVSFLDLRGAASPASDALLPAANPVARQMPHTARDSATPPNGTHSLADPRSHAAPAAAKSAPAGPRAAAAEMIKAMARDAVNGQR